MKKIFLLSVAVIIFLSCNNRQRIENLTYSFKEENGNIVELSFLKNEKVKKTLWFDNTNLVSIFNYNEAEGISTIKFFYEQENIYLKSNFNHSDSIRLVDYYEFFENGLIKRYVFSDSLGYKLYDREYNEYGKMIKSEGRVLLDFGYFKQDSSIYLQFAMPPYCKTYIKYLEYDSEGKQVSDTMYAENKRIIYYKTKTIENRLDFFVYLIDFYNNDTILENTRVRVPAVIELSQSQK